MTPADREVWEALERDMARIAAAFKPVADALHSAAPLIVTEWARAWAPLLNPTTRAEPEQQPRVWIPDPCELCGLDQASWRMSMKDIHWRSHNPLRRGWHHIRRWFR